MLTAALVDNLLLVSTAASPTQVCATCLLSVCETGPVSAQASLAPHKPDSSCAVVPSLRDEWMDLGISEATCVGPASGLPPTSPRSFAAFLLFQILLQKSRSFSLPSWAEKKESDTHRIFSGGPKAYARGGSGTMTDVSVYHVCEVQLRLILPDNLLLQSDVGLDAVRQRVNSLCPITKLPNDIIWGSVTTIEPGMLAFLPNGLQCRPCNPGHIGTDK